MKCCARILSFSSDANLVFVGRSPESFFDYLSGVFSETAWESRLVLVNFSMRYFSLNNVLDPHQIEFVRQQFQGAQLAPADIISSERKLAFVDLVYTGETLGNLSGVLPLPIYFPFFLPFLFLGGFLPLPSSSPSSASACGSVSWGSSDSSGTARRSSSASSSSILR